MATDLLGAEIDGHVLLALVVLLKSITLGLVDDGQDGGNGLADNLAAMVNIAHTRGSTTGQCRGE